MKRLSLIIIALLLLVGCKEDKVNTIYEEKATTITIETIDGTVIIDNLELINELYTHLEFDKVATEKRDVSNRYILKFFGVPNIKIIDGKVITIDNKTYKLPEASKALIELSIKDYIDVEDVEIVEVDPDDPSEPVKQPTPVEAIPVGDMVKVGDLNNGSSVYYEAADLYFNRPLASRIVLKSSAGDQVIQEGSLSLPVISPDGSRMAFVAGVGFEENGRLYVYEDHLNEITSVELVEKEVENRTIKACEWYGDDQLFILLGYDSGNVSQGGDVYSIKVIDGDMRMYVDSKEGKEITAIEFSEGILMYEVVTWLDSSYQIYEYTNESIVLADSMALLPIRVEWESDRLSIEPLSGQEILNGNVPRKISIGDSLASVLNKFPMAYNYLKDENHLLYGDLESGRYATYKNSELFISTGFQEATMTVKFSRGVVSTIEIN